MQVSSDITLIFETYNSLNKSISNFNIVAALRTMQSTYYSESSETLLPKVLNKENKLSQTEVREEAAGRG